MRDKRRCSLCKRNFLVTEHKTRCQRCVLYSPTILNQKFSAIVNHRSLKSFKNYMEKWYGAVA